MMCGFFWKLFFINCLEIASKLKNILFAQIYTLALFSEQVHVQAAKYFYLSSTSVDQKTEARFQYVLREMQCQLTLLHPPVVKVDSCLKFCVIKKADSLLS